MMLTGDGPAPIPFAWHFAQSLSLRKSPQVSLVPDSHSRAPRVLYVYRRDMMKY